MQVRFRHKGGPLVFTLSIDDGLSINPDTNIINAERTSMLKDDAFL